MTKLIKYYSKHFDIVIALHKTQNSPLVDKLTDKDLPRIGYIATYNDIPVAAGFLRKVEGGYCILDTLVTNANISSDIRHLALTELVDKLIDTAKVYKFKTIIAYSMDDGILSRAYSIGFKAIDQSLIALTL